MPKPEVKPTEPETAEQILERLIKEYQKTAEEYAWNPVRYQEGKVVKQQATENLCQQVREAGIDTDTLVHALTRAVDQHLRAIPDREPAPVD